MRDIKAMGAGVDERRTFITTDENPFYDAFIRWQFEVLRRQGRVIKAVRCAATAFERLSYSCQHRCCRHHSMQLLPSSWHAHPSARGVSIGCTDCRVDHLIDRDSLNCTSRTRSFDRLIDELINRMVS